MVILYYSSKFSAFRSIWKLILYVFLLYCWFLVDYIIVFMTMFIRYLSLLYGCACLCGLVWGCWFDYFVLWITLFFIPEINVLSYLLFRISLMYIVSWRVYSTLCEVLLWELNIFEETVYSFRICDFQDGAEAFYRTLAGRATGDERLMGWLVDGCLS
jgi:hypothetical protein